MNLKKKQRRYRFLFSIHALDLPICRFTHSLALYTVLSRRDLRNNQNKKEIMFCYIYKFMNINVHKMKHSCLLLCFLTSLRVISLILPWTRGPPTPACNRNIYIGTKVQVSFLDMQILIYSANSGYQSTLKTVQINVLIKTIDTIAVTPNYTIYDGRYSS